MSIPSPIGRTDLDAVAHIRGDAEAIAVCLLNMIFILFFLSVFINRLNYKVFHTFYFFLYARARKKKERKNEWKNERAVFVLLGALENVENQESLEGADLRDFFGSVCHVEMLLIEC